MWICLFLLLLVCLGLRLCLSACLEFISENTVCLLISFISLSLVMHTEFLCLCLSVPVCCAGGLCLNLYSSVTICMTVCTDSLHTCMRACEYLYVVSVRDCMGIGTVYP